MQESNNNNNTNNNASAAYRKTVEDFGLFREPTMWEPRDTSFIDPYLMYTTSLAETTPSRPSAPEWDTYKITLPPRGGSSSSPKLLNGYAVSPSHHAYVTFCVKLLIDDAADDDDDATSSPRRLTTMRYRDMIADNYTSALSPGATMAELRWLGVANVLHEGSRGTFAKLFRLAGRDILSRGEIEIYPDVDFKHTPQLQSLLLKDPFTRGVLALLYHRAEELGHAFVRRYLFISEGYDDGRPRPRGGPSPLELRLNLVVELARPGDHDGDLKAPLANF